MVSPWVEPGSVYNEEYRHTSLIATLRKTWGLGEAFTGRDASARPFDHVFSRTTPRDPESWAAPKAHPVPEWTADPEVIAQALSSLGKGLVPAFIGMARQMGVPLPAELNDPEATLPPGPRRRRPPRHLRPLLPAARRRRERTPMSQSPT